MFHGAHAELNAAAWNRRRAQGIQLPHGRAMRRASIDMARRYVAMARWYRISRAMLAESEYWRGCARVAHRAGQSLLGDALHAKADRIEAQAYALPHPLA